MYAESFPRQSHLQSPGVEQDLAAGAFLHLLSRLRESFLQDVVIWREHLPNFFVWQNPLFADPEYLQFEERARLNSINRDGHIGLEVQRVLPLLTSQLMAANSSHGKTLEQLMRGVQSIESDNSALANNLDQGFAKTHDVLGRLLDALSRPIVIPEQIIPEHSIPGPLQVQNAINEASTSSSSSNGQPMSRPNPSTASASGTTTALPPAILPFQMSRSIDTVCDLWREYSVGLPGQPSVRTMYEGGSTEWKKKESERRFYQRRKVILQVVEDIANKRGIPAEEAAAVVDKWRTRQSNTSLNYLSTSVKQVLMDE